MSAIRLDNTKYLLRIVEGAKTPLRSVVQQTYSRHALAFPETLAFLTAVHVLRRNREELLPGKHFATTFCALTTSDSEYAKCVLELAVTSASDYGQELRQYLLAFSGTASALSMPRLGGRDSRYAARDTLVSAGVVVLDHDSGVAILRPEYYRLYALSHCHQGLSPTELVDLEAQKRDLGHRAELVVLGYERRQVGRRFANQVVHVALHSASAGFDIASLRVKDGGLSVEPRLIEVKAVGREELGFFWSSQEANVARKAGDAYFLYLVPVREGEPTLEELVVIRDPARSVLNTLSEWDVQASGYYCRRRPRNEA